MDWAGAPNPTQAPGCAPGTDCLQFPTANLTNYVPPFGCGTSTAWLALTTRFPNSPSMSNGIKFIFLNNIVHSPPPVIGPPFAIETVPTYDTRPSAGCPTGNDIVMSSQAYANVGAHAVGHVLGLDDLRGAAANGPSGPNLMCSGDAICADSSQIGSYLTIKQKIDAGKGILQWLPKAN